MVGANWAVLIVSTFPTRYFGTGLILSWLMMDDPNPKLLTDLGKRKGFLNSVWFWRARPSAVQNGSGCLVGKALGMGSAPQDILMTELIMVDEVFQIPAHAYIRSRRVGGIAKAAGKSDFRQRWYIQYTLYFSFDWTITEDGEYVHSQSQSFTHEPHVFHHASKPHLAEGIPFRGRGAYGRVIENDQQYLWLQNSFAELR
jgi:hypothetical protein